MFLLQLYGLKIIQIGVYIFFYNKKMALYPCNAIFHLINFRRRIRFDQGI